MERTQLQIGMKVKVIPAHTYNDDGSIKRHPEFTMWVRELHNEFVAGLSHKRNGKTIYGILYGIINPIKADN